MKNTRTIREKIATYNAQNLESIRNADNPNNRDSQLWYALAYNTSRGDLGFALVKSAHIASGSVAQGCNLPSDEIVRWGGYDRTTVLHRLGDAVYFALDVIGVEYKTLDKDLQGTRAESAEKVVLDALKQAADDKELVFRHIGNHRQKGWRDVAVYRGERRVALIEVKGKNGRMI